MSRPNTSTADLAADPGCRLILGDCASVMATLEAESVDAIVCDPPYEIGLMGKAWDSSGVTYQPSTWEAALRLLKPGGHLLAFGAARTYHRLGVAIEDAGFEIRDSLHWFYGSGMPKSRDVAKAIDGMLGAERDVVGSRSSRVTEKNVWGAHVASGMHREGEHTWEVTAPKSAEGKQWAGWGTALKPGHEPVVLARKPFTGTVAANILEYGTGGLNIDGCEIGSAGGSRTVSSRAVSEPKERTTFQPIRDYEREMKESGRWPTNALLTHSIECLSEGVGNTMTLCVEGCPARQLDESADRPARFFYCAKPRTREKVAGTMRNLHPSVKPVDIMAWLIRLVTPPGGIVLDPFLGSGTTGCAAMVEGVGFVGIEQDADYFALARDRISDYAFSRGRQRPVAS